MAERPLYTLYKNLKAQNYDVPDDYNKFESALTRDGKGGADNRHAIYENLKAQNFDVPSTYERFYSALFEPRSRTSSRAKGGSVPMSAADRARFSARTAAILSSANNAVRQAKRNIQTKLGQAKKFDGGRVTPRLKNPLQNQNVQKNEFNYNATTGKTGTYTTTDGVEFDNEYDAAQYQNQLDKQGQQYINAVNAGEIPSVFDVRDKKGNYDLQENINKNGTYLTEEGAQKQFDKKLADAYARKKEIEALIAEDNRQHGNPLLSYGASIGASNGRTAEQSDYRNKLATSLSLVTEQIGALEAVKQYPTSSWGEDALKALDNTAFTAKTWDFGLTDFATMGQMERIKTKMDNNIPLSGSDKMLLKSKLGADAAAALEDEKMGNIYRWTKIAGQSLPFMFDFFLTGGYGGITKGISRGALKFAAKRGMGKVSAAILKNTGIVAGDVIGSYAMAGTEQALKTGADIMQRHLGNLYQDEKGDYKFGTFDENGNLLHEGGESMGTALYKGLTSAMVENYTEKLFGHNYGIKKGAVNFMEKHGMNASAEFFKNIGKSGWYTNSKKWMEKFGINGFAEEVMEEEIAIPLHAVLDGEGKITDLLKADQQLDIIGGMALSVGSMYAMGAGSRPVKGIYNRAQYYRFRNKVNVADSDAQNLLGDNWADIKDKIDNATNEQMGSVLADILRQRDTMTKEQINAAVNYGINLMKMRGYNIAKTAEMNAKEITNEPTTPEEQHQTDIDNAYSEGHDADDADKHDIQIQQEDQMKTLAAALGISEQQLSAMSDEELESLTGQDDKLDQAIYDYQLSSARYQGVVDDAQDKVDLAAHQAAQRVDMYTDQSRGSVRNATIKASGGLEDYGVYIISGNIATHDDGSIDVSNSDDMILYFDPTTNSVEHADALMFAELGEELPADDVKAQAVADAKENAIKEIAGIIDGTVEVGSQFNVTGADGMEHTYEVLADYGDGTAAISIDGNVVENPYSFEDLQNLKDLEDQKRLEAAKAQREQLENERAAQQNQETEETQPSFDFNQILNDDGNVVLVDVLDKDGNTKYPDSRLFLIRDTGAKAKVVELMSDGSLVPHAVSKKNVSIITSMSLDEYKQAMAESSMIEDNSGENRGEIEVEASTIEGETAAPAEETAAPESAETPTTEQTPAAPAITLEDGTIVPMLEDGNPDFSKLTAAQTAELYDNQFGEDADSIVSGYVSDAKKALDKASNMTVKGKTFVEQKAAKDAKEKAIADAQAAYDSAVAIRDAYNERQLAKVEDTAEGRKELIEKARRKFARLKSAVKDDAEAVSQLYKETVGTLMHRLYDGTGIDVTDTIPLTAEEYVASNLGAHSLNYEGTETSKGVKQETGLNREDFAKTQLLAADGKGTTIDNLVHSLWENRPSNLESLGTQDIRNALLSVITSGFKASEARNYIENLRIAQAENILEEQKKAADNAAFAEENKAETEQQTETAPELSNEQQKAKEDGEKLGFPAIDKEGEPINEYVIELANWAKEQGLEIDPTSKSNSYADLFLMCKDGFGVSTIVPDEGENINQVVYFPDNVQDFDQLWKLQEEFNAGRDLKHSSNIDSEITEGATFYDADTAREFKEFVDKKVEEQNKVFGEQRPEEDLPFSARDNGTQQTTSERAADVEKNKVDDMKVVDNIVGQQTRKAFERLAKMMGANIQWQYSDKLGNGWIQETTDADGNVHRTIFITLDSSITEGAQFIFGHEMTHQIKSLNPAAYNELTQLVLDTYGSDAFDKAVDETMQRYSDAGFSGRARDYYAEEVVADAVGEMIRDLNLAHTLAMKMSHPLLAAIHEILQKIKLAFFGTEYSDVTKNIIRSIEQAYVKTAKGEVTNSETGEDVSFSLRQKPEPKKKGIGYKVFVLKDGKLYPPMVANPNGAATPVGVWLDADAAPIAGESKTGRPQVKQGGKGTQGGSGKLAYRPGWHLGVVPYAIQFNRKDAEGNKTLFPKNFVFAEVEYAADVDYQEEARQEGINPSGKYQHSLAGLKHLPTDGYYMYRTNPNPETDPWVITGAMKVNRILTRAEQAELVKNAGREPQQIQEGDIVTDDVVNSINQEIADAPKFSLKVYHGSGADFTEFDFDHMGEGAGSQAFGWGGYVTSSKKIGKDYAAVGQQSAESRHAYSEDTPIEAAVSAILGQDMYNNQAKTFEQKKAQAIKNAENSIASFSDMLKNSNELDEKGKKFLQKSIENDKKKLEVLRTLTEEQYKEEYIKQGRAKNLYEVDIPEDNGSNYIEFYEDATPEFKEQIKSVLANGLPSELKEMPEYKVAEQNFYEENGTDESFEKSLIDDALFELERRKSNGDAYNALSVAVGDKLASKILSSLGYTGIKYPAGTIMGGVEGDETNYVIFKPEDMRITEHTKFSIKTYHGSQASFDHFDHSFMGSGEGAQAYGWGTYVSEVEGIAKAYAKQNTAKRNTEYTVAKRAYEDAETEYKNLTNYIADSELNINMYNIPSLESYKKKLEMYKEKGIQHWVEVYEQRVERVEKSIKEERERIEEYKLKQKEAYQLMDEAKKKLDSIEKPKRNLYSVDIPDDTGRNYIGWDEPLGAAKIMRLPKVFKADGWEYKKVGMYDTYKIDGNEHEVWLEPSLTTGKELYRDLTNALGSDKAASEFLSKAGFVGVKVIAQRNTGGNKEGKMNYVIFDENNAQITSHTKFSLRLKSAIDETETNPSDAQKESGNYKKGHIKFGGYDYTIENPKGSTRSGKDADGKEWKVTMHDTYGYIRGKFGKDGDHLDMFINDKADLDNWNGDVFVVDQVNPDGSFDEHKVMYGYDSMDDAKKAYLANYSDGWQGLGNITGVSKVEFDKWLDTSNRKLKPFADYAKVKFSQAQSVNNEEPKTFEEFLNHPSLKFSIKNEEQRRAAEDAYEYASKLRPNKYAQYALVDMSNPSNSPEYYEKKVLADRWRRFYNKAVHNELDDVYKDAWGNYKLFDLDRPFADQVNEVKGDVPSEFNAPDVVANKNADNESGVEYHEYKQGGLSSVTYKDRYKAFKQREANREKTAGLRKERKEVEDSYNSKSKERIEYNKQLMKEYMDKHGLSSENDIPYDVWDDLRSKSFEKYQDELDSLFNKYKDLDRQIKAVAEPRFSLKDEKTLAGVHNITEEKLLKAIKQGGLANPSVAVIDSSKQNHEDYGDISLILPSDKVAKRTGKNAGTWQGDAWTPTYPQVERQMSNKGAEKASKDVASVPNDMYSEVRRGLDRWLDGGEPNSAMAYMFLHEKGVAPEPKNIQHKYSDEDYNELKTITTGDFNIYGIGKADAQKVLDMYIEAKFDGDKDLYEEKTKAWLERNKAVVDAGTKGGMRYAIAKENVELYDEYGFNYKGVQTFVRDVEYDHRRTGVDMNATLNEVEDYIKTNNLTDEFNSWLEGKEKEYGIKEVIFDGFTPSGNRRYVPNTLENVSKIMKKQGRNGATGTSVSFQNFAAKLMPSYGTLKDIRSKKGLLTSDHEDLDKFNEKWANVFFELGMKCQPDATGTFDDYGLARLSEAAMTSDPQAYLKKEYNVDFSDEDTKRLKEMVKAIKEEYPAMYFETKFERPVGFDEFSSAVVPTTASNEVKQALQNAGVQIYEYDKEKEGDRSRAFNEAINSSDNIRFSLAGERGAAAADKADERTFRMDNLSVAKDMEKNKKKAKAIKAATGWERGADGKWRYEMPDVVLRDPKEWVNKKNLTLSDIVEKPNDLFKEYPELFDAYPELKDMKILKGRAKSGGVFYNNAITLNLGDIREAIKYDMDTHYKLANNSLKKTLVHEIQHYIQDKEGFAQGGNSEMIIDKNALDAIAKLRAEKDAVAKEFYAMSPEEKQRRKYEINNRYNDLTKQIERLEKSSRIGYDGYQRLAGEVEARNVSARLNMTPEERRKTLAESTEDVARKDQILLGVGDVSFSLRDMADGKDSGAADMAEDLKSLNTPDEVDDAIKTAIEDMPSGWKMANKKMIHIAQALGENRKAEIAGEEPKFSLKDGSLIKAGTYFSGGGLVEEGLKGIIDPVVAVEYDEKISGVYRNNFGQHIVTADVRDVDPKELVKQIDGEVEYFHASPVCKNYSQAKSNHAEVELDKETAASTAEFINAIKPKVVTIENVKGYKNSDAMKTITDALDANGYTWDADVYNAADYGGYTNRERLIVRAVRDGKLPEKPKKMAHKSGWYEAVADIIPTLTEKKNGVAPWMDVRLKADGIDWRNIDKPLYVMGSAYADGKVPHAFADELLPTLRTKSGDVIVMPDGKVYRAMGRVLARVSGVSDDYKMPFSENLSHTIIGNGIPTQLTEHVIAPLLNGSDPKFSIRTYHGTGASFDKFDLSHALEGEGSETFGHGVYVTNSSKIGREYAQRVKQRKMADLYKNMRYPDGVKGDIFKRRVFGEMVNDVATGGSVASAKEFAKKRIGADANDIQRTLENLKDREKGTEYEQNLKDRLAEYKEGLKWIDSLDEDYLTQGNANRYDVDIPDDNGSNYLDWENPMSEEQINAIRDALAKKGVDVPSWEKRGFKLDLPFKKVYSMVLPMMMRSKPEDVSKFLSSLGFTGIKYPAGMIYGGAEEGDYNYVIFDENNANIVGNTRFSLRYDQFEHDLNQWKKDNNLPKDAQRPTIPQRNVGESAVDFLRRVDEYRKQMALWKTAPTYEQHLLSDDTALGEFNRELQRGSVLKRIAFQDSMLAIRKAQEAIMKEVGVDRLNMAEDAYTAENRSHGKGKNEFEEYNNEFLQPLRKAYHQMKKILGDSYDNVRIYMMAKHGLERDAQMAFKKSLDADFEDVAQRSAAYRAYKGDMNRITNDSDLEFGRVDFNTWRQRDNALRTKYSPSYMDYRYDENGIAYDYSGLSALFGGSDFEEAAHKLVRDIESSHVAEVQDLWNATNAATKKILRDGYKAGMMSKDTYQYVRDMYSHYIPLRGWDGTTADQVWDYVGGGKGAFNQTLKTAHGRTSIADDPIAYIENMAESGILLNNKNWVKQHLMLLAQNHPTSLLTLSKAWYVKSTDANGNEEWIPATPQITSQMNSNQVKAAIDAFEQQMENMAQTGNATQKRDGLNIAYPQTHSEEREHEVRVMKDGEEYVIYVNGDPQLAQAMNNTRAHRVREIQSGKLDKAAAWLGRKMAAAYTSLSPLFIPSNYFRDLTMTLASTAIREDAKYNYLLRKNLATSWNLGFMLRDYQSGKLREKVSNGNATQKEQMFYDFMMNGGETGFVSSLDVEDLKKKFKNDLKDLDRWKANPVKVGHTIMDGIEFLNRAIEDSNRFAVYMTSIQYGRSIDEAVNDAKDVTLNFNRKGTGEYGWQMVRNLYLFINPAVQSLQTLGALAKHHPFKFTAVTASWLVSGVLVPIVNAALMNLLGGDDDKDKYWQFTKWDRRNNLIMWVPFTHEYVKIPLAQEFRAFYGVGDMIASKVMGGELAEESWSQYAEDLLGQVVDMLPLDPTGYDGNIAVSLMPNAIRPVFELAFNVDFTGKPLFKDTEYNKYDPNFTKAYVGTPDWLVRASRMMNSIGNDYPDVQQNSIDAFGDPRYNLNNPAVVDHVLSSYFGGAYTMGSQVLGVLTKSLNDPKEIKVADIPLFSKFVSNPDDRPVTKKQGDEFWDMKENHDRAANTLSKLKKQAKVDGDYSMLERFYDSEEYQQYKQDDVKVKKYEEDKKKERAEESGEEYRPHKLNAEDIYKAHATPKDDFEDLKLKQLYTKLNGFKTSYDLLVDTAPSQSDGYYNTNKAAIDAIDEISLDKQEISELKKGFLDDGKDAYNAEDMKQIRELRKKILAVLEKANKVVVANQKAKAEK